MDPNVAALFSLTIFLGKKPRSEQQPDQAAVPRAVPHRTVAWQSMDSPAAYPLLEVPVESTCNRISIIVTGARASFCGGVLHWKCGQFEGDWRDMADSQENIPVQRVVSS